MVYKTSFILIVVVVVIIIYTLIPKKQIYNDNEPWVKTEVSNRLNRLTNKVNKLVDDMYTSKFPSPKTSHRLYTRWNNIKKKGIRETEPHEDTAAYTVDKDKEVRICVRSKKNKKLEDENTMMFVMLHELGHIMSESYGHNTEFHTNFSHITQRAIDMDLYTYEHFMFFNKEYCGTNITSSPV